MKKIPSVFKRDYEGTRLVTNEIVLGCEWVLNGEGIATEKHDGTACMIRDNKLYKRYDAKKGKAHPVTWEPCEAEPDKETGHWPGWLPVGAGPEDKWHRQAFAKPTKWQNGTYELIGPKVQSNPYGLTEHRLVPHGLVSLDDAPRTFDLIKDYLAEHSIEGIVWHHPDGRMAKIKRKDFGFEWPIKKES